MINFVWSSDVPSCRFLKIWRGLPDGCGGNEDFSVRRLFGQGHGAWENRVYSASSHLQTVLAVHSRCPIRAVRRPRYRVGRESGRHIKVQVKVK